MCAEVKGRQIILNYFLAEMKPNPNWQSRGDDGKLASYEVAGLDETNDSCPEGTMEDCPRPPSFQDEILFGLHPATMWLANFRLSLRDEADRIAGYF
jgi:hypothetical protein